MIKFQQSSVGLPFKETTGVHSNAHIFVALVSQLPTAGFFGKNVIVGVVHPKKRAIGKFLFQVFEHGSPFLWLVPLWVVNSAMEMCLA